MADPRFDVVGIGNAIVDVLAHADEAFLVRHGLDKGTMTLIDVAQAEALYAAMGPAVEVSGGSAANTIAALAVARRQAAPSSARSAMTSSAHLPPRHRLARRRLPDAGRHRRPADGRCLVLVTPDADRTLQTFLGIAADIGPEDVDEDLIAAARITYLEGYLWDQPRAKRAFVLAAELAHAHQRDVALSLSDPFCVDRHRIDFLRLIADHVDVLFANEDEIVSLFEEHSFDGALQRIRHQCRIAVLTRSEKGSVIVAGDDVHVVDADPVAAVVDFDRRR